jgi:phosphohistidine phosphatase
VKTLFLVRHAKSSRDDPTIADRDRPLNERGLRDAPKIGERLAKRNVKPEVILSSPALRALTTAQLMAKKLDYKAKDIVVDDRAYASSPKVLLEIIHGLDDKLKCVMLFGHNPEMSALANRLSLEITDMATCAVAEFEFDIRSWTKVGETPPDKVRLDEPKR